MTTFNSSGMSNFRGSVPYSSPQPQTPQPQLHQAMYSEGPNFSGSVSYAPHHQQPMQAMNTVFPSSQPQPSSSVWLADSGATNHMSADLSNLSLVAPYPATDRVQTANGEGLLVSHVGTSIIPTSNAAIKLKSVLYVPQLTQNLLSVHRLCLDNNYRLIFDAFSFWIQDRAMGRIIYTGRCSNGLYPLPFVPHSSPAYLKLQPQCHLGQLVFSCTWHSRLGHPTNRIASLMLQKANVAFSIDSNSSMCHSCLQGKFSKLPFHSSHTKSVIPFQTIHSDLWGPSPCVSIDGYKYYVTFIDEFSRYCWLFPLVNKSDVYSVFIAFYNYVNTQFSSKIKILQSDGGGEYTSHKLKLFFHAKGIVHQKSCPYTPEQNGLAERKHRHLIETTITLLQHAKLPSSF